MAGYLQSCGGVKELSLVNPADNDLTLNEKLIAVEGGCYGTQSNQVCVRLYNRMLYKLLLCVCVSGWKFGAVFGRSGAFPVECVHPVAPPDFLSLPLDRTAEPRGGAGQFAASSAIAVAVGSTMAAQEIDQTIEVHKHTTKPMQSSVRLFFTVDLCLSESFS